MTSTTRILIIDDKPLVRRGISLLIEQQEDMEVVGDFSRSADIRVKFDEAPPDVILINVHSSDPEIFDVIKVLSVWSENTRVLVLSEENDQRIVHRAL